MNPRLLRVTLLILAGTPMGAYPMTYEEAVERIPERRLPEFFTCAVEAREELLSRIEHGDVSTIAMSPGGRPLQLVAFGEAEPARHAANFNSAIGGRDPSAYMDKASRRKPVVLFVGPVHAQETEGLAGLCNLAWVMETGSDLRGREWPDLRALGDRCRVLIIPDGNPDGLARFQPGAMQGMYTDDVRFWGQGTWSDDEFCGWPECKRQHPMVGDNVGFPGCYFNDDGINPMHDEFFAPMGPEAPAILKVAMDEGADLAVSLHSHQSAPALLRPSYVTTEIQDEVRALAVECYELLAQRELPHGKPFTTQPEGGANPAPFNLVSAIYHVSGASSFTFECPHGLLDEGACEVTPDEIVDIQLTLYEAMMRRALAAKAQEPEE
jgi:hypothetical protein